MELPYSIQRELEAALIRTGDSQKLEKAAQTIAALLEMEPLRCEWYMSLLYREMK